MEINQNTWTHTVPQFQLWLPLQVIEDVIAPLWSMTTNFHVTYSHDGRSPLYHVCVCVWVCMWVFADQCRLRRWCNYYYHHYHHQYRHSSYKWWMWPPYLLALLLFTYCNNWLLYWMDPEYIIINILQKTMRKKWMTQ